MYLGCGLCPIPRRLPPKKKVICLKTELRFIKLSGRFFGDFTVNFTVSFSCFYCQFCVYLVFNLVSF